MDPGRLSLQLSSSSFSDLNRREYRGAENEDDFDVDPGFIDDYITEDVLREATGQTDLLRMRELEILVDTTQNSIGNLGQIVPSLLELKLNNSRLTTLRDLGTGFKGLRVLWVSRCGLDSIEGLSAFPTLEELYMSFNGICDLSPLAGVDTLKVIDLEANGISDIQELYYLSGNEQLTSLTFEGNPCAGSGGALYRRLVCTILPQLQVLDDIDVTSADRVAVEDVTKSCEELLTEGKDVAASDATNGGSKPSPRQEMNMVNEGIRASTAIMYEYFQNTTETQGLPQRPISARPPSARMRPLTARRRPVSAVRRPQSARIPRPSTARLRDSIDRSNGQTNATEEDTSSSLTYGSEIVLCGNPIRGLRQRKTEQSTVDSNVKSETGAEHPSASRANVTVETEIFHELRDLKLQELADEDAMDEEEEELQVGDELDGSEPVPLDQFGGSSDGNLHETHAVGMRSSTSRSVERHLSAEVDQLTLRDSQSRNIIQSVPTPPPATKSREVAVGRLRPHSRGAVLRARNSQTSSSDFEMP